MAFNFTNANVAVREQRLGSVTGYSGDLKDIVEKSHCGTLKNKERCFSQSSTCLSGCGLNRLTAIRNVAVIYHAPAGCAAPLANGSRTINDQLATRINEETNTVMICTDLNEHDTIFGATKALREIIQHTYNKYSPEAIFVSTSCVSGVIGENIDDLVEEMKSELPVPIVPVHCEGFKSRIWASGFDIADHAIMQGIVQPPKEKRNVINFKNFYESARPQITKIFGELGVKPQFLYSNATVDEIRHISESLATVCVCGTLGTYLGNALEQTYGVPYIKTINFCGVTGFETWLREIGRVIGKEKEVESYIERQRAIYLPKIEEVTKELNGLRAVIGMGPGYTYEVARVLQEFGMEVVWAMAWHYDFKYDDGKVPPALDHLLKANEGKELPVSISDQQNYEVLNILNRYKPDIYFSRHPGSTVWAIKQGYAACYVADEYTIFGYEGTLSFAKRILDTVRNRSFEKNLAAHIKVPYTDWWYEQNSDKFLTGGVRN